MKFSKPLSYLLSFFYPNRCPFCGNVSPPFVTCCDNCRHKIKIQTGKYFIGNRWLCTSPFRYSGLPKQAVLKLKFNSCGQISWAMGKYMTDAIKESFSDYSFDVVTFVPMHKKRKRKSLYNHSKLLASSIAKNLSLPMKNLLIKTEYNKPQHKLNRDERIKAIKNTFRADSKSLDFIKGKTILLCDDVLTTGSTLSECCKVLEKAGAKDVFCVAFAKA